MDEKHAAPSEEVKAPMAGLSEQEKEIIERQIDAPKLTVGYFALFRYATKNEFLIMIIALIASIAAGATMPLMTVSRHSHVRRLITAGVLCILGTDSPQVVYGNFAGSFTSLSVDAVAIEQFQNQINTLTLYFVYLGWCLFSVLNQHANWFRHCIVLHFMDQYRGVFVHRREDNSTDPRAVPPCYLQAKHCFLRLSG